MLSLPGASQLPETEGETAGWQGLGTALGGAGHRAGSGWGLVPPDSFPLKGWSCAGPAPAAPA